MKRPDFFSKRTKEIRPSSFRRRAVFSFVSFAVLLLVAIFFWKWLNHQPTEQGALKPLRKTLEANEKILKTAVFDTDHLAKEFPEKDAVKNVRVNGLIGMEKTIDTSTWRLNVVRSTGDTLKLSLDDIKKLPRKDVIFDFKCIEGWSQVTHWAGVPLKTFMQYYHLDAQEKLSYVGLQTVDKKYYVGIDMPSAMQSQTILCYEMNNKALPMNQGFPLRLIIPVKYGIKHLKQIGTIYFSNQKPPDYWAERGYDYYAGL
ncbi:MAG TPA: molybdopterin-dependent oxidoreductase [Parafilimonas sp.]|nr:molybdopterin-dependent oxidoreductase [Parafilimonas sp.]